MSAPAFVPDTSPAGAFFATPIPEHDDGPSLVVASRIVATFPIGTFVENVLACDDGSLVASIHSERRLVRWNERDGVTPFAALPASPTAVNAHPDGGFVVTGGTVGEPPGYVWHVADDGSTTVIMRVEDARFLNGATPVGPYRLLAVDSLLGCVYAIDLEARRASVWFADERLAKISAEAMLPGANGIKRFGDAIYVTNTDRAIIARIALRRDGAAGDLTLVAERLRADDLAFASDGTAYLATHIHNSVIRLAPDGSRATIAGAAAGLAGSTGVAFGRGGADTAALFVTTTGGVLAPLDGIPQPAKLVRLEVGVSAAPIGYDWEDRG